MQSKLSFAIIPTSPATFKGFNFFHFALSSRVAVEPWPGRVNVINLKPIEQEARARLNGRNSIDRSETFFFTGDQRHESAEPEIVF